MSTSNRRGAARVSSICLCVLTAALVVASPVGGPVGAAPTGLVSHWKLDETTGTQTKDALTSLTGALMGGAKWTTGRFGSAVLMDGVDDYVALPSRLNVPGSQLTLAAWVKNTAFPSNVSQRFIAKAKNADEDGTWFMLAHVNADGEPRLRFRVRAGGSTATLTASKGALPLNTWYHAAATYDGTTMRLYLNGALVGSRSKGGSIATSDAIPVTIGRSYDNSNYLRGAIDDVQIYTRALTATEVSGLAKGTTTSSPVEPTSSSGATISLTAPAAGTNYGAPGSITISAATTGNIKKVDFYGDGKIVGSDTTAPYSVVWTNVPAGTRKIQAVARPVSGGSAYTDTRVVTVGGSTSTSTGVTISLTGPHAGTNYSAPGSITISAATTGNIKKVDFYGDGKIVGSDTTAPYSVVWTNVPAGTRKIQAVARPVTGGSAYTDTRVVTVGGSASTPPPAPAPAPAPNKPPTVSLTAPAAGSTFTAPATIELRASAADSDGTVARVDFYNGSTLLGTDTTSPYAFSWTNVPANGYAVRAVARDNAGATTVSATHDITVRSASMPSLAVFTPSSDHSSGVERYVVEFFNAGADPTKANPVISRDVGKPAVVGGECKVDVASTITALAPGTYIATVTAVGPGGQAQSLPSLQFTR